MSDWSDPASWKVVVTGGSSGLGASTCARLMTVGAAVVSLDRRMPEGETPRAPTETVDLADAHAAWAATRRAVERLGGLDALVCCAGVDVPGRLDEVSLDDWRRVLDVNLVGTAAVVHAALPALEATGGRLVTVASTLAHRAVSDATAYCASKFGVVGFTRALTAELKGQVGVTLLTPGGMHTGFFDERAERYRPPADAVLADPGAVADSVCWVLGRPPGLEVRELAVMSPHESSWP